MRLVEDILVEEHATFTSDVRPGKGASQDDVSAGKAGTLIRYRLDRGGWGDGMIIRSKKKGDKTIIVYKPVNPDREIKKKKMWDKAKATLAAKKKRAAAKKKK